ncbi:Os07g0495250 [Oryza sativa Japonica Group]|uniref:Os07g0495250 protein n=1 Tax=Oryza sativa subsp. japonica TaxID=39947 RepID=A0A0P0X6C0_ORYSJ|nr:hypothetical protein EE612_039359 [Oryza sativa]BAT01593.1 Os07g0495250 [Oryza sativa Japonica Group]
MERLERTIQNYTTDADDVTSEEFCTDVHAQEECSLNAKGLQCCSHFTYLTPAQDLKALTSSILLLCCSVFSCSKFKFLYRFLCSFRKTCLYFHLSQYILRFAM